ncbi:MAG: tetratricopeptide repeat protein [Eudoraea sp.]|uniref:tetratricopeptide repeat protein n=2 Tax=Eudoraea sp. TaxID=1979955 RepID=UPI003C712718
MIEYFIPAALKFSFFKHLSKFVLTVFLVSCNGIEKEAYVKVADMDQTASFVGTASCIECHQEEYELWENSHHDEAMKIADSTTILADFNNTTFTYKGVKSSFFLKEGDYYVNTQGEDGNYSDFKIIYTFGYTPLQQYIVQFPNGEYNCLLTAWDTVEEKWFHLQPDLDIKHDEWINWSGGSQRWNTMCADCHSTNLQKNYDLSSGVFNTTFSEINVACEACHGPSGTHVSYYKEQEENEANGVLPPELYIGSSVPPKELVDKCARCHSRRGNLTPYFDYTGTFMDHYFPRMLEEPLYELDGQIRDEVYVYTSFLESKMYGLGISCKDCHDVHSLKLKKEGNDLCLTCHIPDKYDTPDHHYHAMNTDAALCINCHMDGKLYMVNDYRRDHSFRIPRPDQSVTYSTPNACNKCHTDKSAKWASDFIVEKYGPTRADHFSDHLLKGYMDDNQEFKKVFSSKEYPEIARATAIGLYVNSPISYEDALDLTRYLNDSSILVRNQTVRAFETIGSPDFAPQIVPLLKDSVRAVRISAAHYYNVIGKSQVEHLEEFKLANQEYMTELEINSDFPAGLHQLGIYNQSIGEIDKALDFYSKAVKEDNYFNMSRINMALIYYQQGLVDKSEATYLKIIEQEPEYSYTYYMLGLLYYETNRKDKALEYLALACSKEPANANASYNYALMLQQENKNSEAINIIDKALESFPNNERLLYVKLLSEINLNQQNRAMNTCRLLLQINPTSSDYNQILKRLQQGS